MTEENPENLEEIEENVEDELKKLPNDQVQHIIERHVKSGPLPNPDDFRKYEEALPGAADRILKMAEMEQEHRHSTNDKDMIKIHDNTYNLTKYGMTTGLITGIVGTVAGALVLIFGHPAPGTIVVLASMLPIIVNAIKSLFKKDSSSLSDNDDSE